MTSNDQDTLIEKAKSRRDGVYSYRGYLYVVKDNKFLAFADFFGQCFQCMGGFNVVIGKVERYDRRKKLVEWLKSQTKTN